MPMPAPVPNPLYPPAYPKEFTFVLPAVRKDGLAFVEMALICIAAPEFVQEFDRLTHSNLRRRGSGLELAIDDACGRMDQDFKKFLQFVWDSVFLRLPLIEETKK